MDVYSKEEREADNIKMNEIFKELRQEEDEAHEKDSVFLEAIKKEVSDEYFDKIKWQLEESENPSNYRFVTKPIGDLQKEDDFIIWIVQTCGHLGDDYSGTICMKICEDKYFMWNYWM